MMNTKLTESTVRAEYSAGLTLITVAAIAIFTQLISSLIHEVIGHSLAMVLVGGQLEHFSSVDAEYSANGVSMAGQRIVHMAGITMNLFFGFIALAFYRFLPKLSSNTRYFLWLLGHVNLFIGGGYMMALSFAGFGDVDDFVNGLPSPVIWKFAFTLLGIAISFATLRHGIKTLDPFLGNDYATRRKRGRELTLFPYLVAGVLSVIAGLFNPTGMILVATSAAASSFGGQFFLAWMCLFVREKKTDAPKETLLLSRSNVWIVLGIFAAVVDIVLLGPGLPR